MAQTVKNLPAIRETWVLSLVKKIPWRRKWQPSPVFWIKKWQPTPVLLPGESHGWRSLASYSPRGHKELDTTEQLHFHSTWWFSGKEFHLQCRRPGYHSWVRKIPWRQKGQPTAVFLPGKSHGQRSLAGYSPWGCEESDTT